MTALLPESPAINRWVFVAAWAVALAGAGAEENSISKSTNFAPEPLTEEDFRAVIEHSPFTRTVRLTDSLILTGIAHLGRTPVVALLDAEDGSSISISDSPNARGWRLVDLRGEEDLESAMVSMAFPTGEVIRIRHDKDRIKLTTQRMGFQRRAQAQRAAAMQRLRDRAANGGANSHGVPPERVNLLQKIDRSELPKGYNPGAGGTKEAAHRLHQSYVDRKLAGMSEQQRGRVGQLWSQQQAVNPLMKNRGASFVRIMEHVVENESR